MDLSHVSKSTLRTLVSMGNVSREYAAQIATARVNTYREKGKSQSKIDGWIKLAAFFTQADDTTPKASKPKAKAKAKPKAEPQAELAPAFTKANVARYTKASVRDLIASRRILSKAEKAGIVEFLTRI